MREINFEARERGGYAQKSCSTCTWRGNSLSLQTCEWEESLFTSLTDMKTNKSSHIENSVIVQLH